MLLELSETYFSKVVLKHPARLYQTRGKDEKETDVWPSINGLRRTLPQPAGIGSEAQRTRQTPFFIVQVGQFQWPDGGFQGWAGSGQVPFLLAEPPG